jgi:hypothetical protein
VAEAIQESLEEIKARQDDIQKMKTDLGLGGDSDADAALRYSIVLCKNQNQKHQHWFDVPNPYRKGSENSNKTLAPVR